MAVAETDLTPARPRSPATWTPYLLILPTLIFLGLFFVYPMVQAVWLAVSDPQSGGLTWAHFRRMGADLYFAPAVRYTLLITALAVPLQVMLGLAIALLVNTRFLGHSAFLYLTALPIGISDLAAGLIWLSIFTERGYLNAVLQRLGLVEVPLIFLSVERPDWMLGAIVITEVWRATAIVMVILLAGLQLIPRDYAETASVFGAGRWQTLRHVILPLLRPSLQTALIIRTILAFQLFATVVTLAGRQIPVLAGEAYFWYSLYRSPHVASAYAVLILLFSGSITWLYLRFLRAEEGRA
ncbi:MAG: sugar ABC transporter permease [Armatimonadota bacterium]|nr:sugar ABC transporter permease [Armatimonadota bacterium]MDR7451233.1 sugar ABC transporter permease [Armatimonadota bacterium]MDR7466864.1 sugar ABC transporter permease [Armatimonadota bacterium]MDR7492663.1 sugar ABC transporter permease [Armatimonadota bacterium]MDR7499975.1 sugar ABC transporter permease [Armatimonadota bacterium]